MAKRFEEQIKIFHTVFENKYQINPISRTDKDIVMEIANKLKNHKEMTISGLLLKSYKVEPDMEVLANLLELEPTFQQRGLDDLIEDIENIEEKKTFIQLTDGEIIRISEIVRVKKYHRYKNNGKPVYGFIINPVSETDVLSIKLLYINEKFEYSTEEERDENFALIEQEIL